MNSFQTVVERFVNERSDRSMEDIIEWTRNRPLTGQDIAYLAKQLAKSGEILSLAGSNKAADIASTGGPTSLSTILCPLYLRVLGCVVPKLGIPGRPAGGVDVLAQIPRYKVRLEREEINECIDECGYVHFLVDTNHAPLDAKLFVFRQRMGAQTVPALVIASILSKKLVVGLSRVGLDVRVASHGNFGATWEEARTNAQRFCEVSKLLGIESICFLTDGRTPYQPYIGRGESLVALARLFDGKYSEQLGEHANMCFKMALKVSKKWGASYPSGDELRICFTQNLKAQGSDFGTFIQKVNDIEDGHRFFIISDSEGFLGLDISRIRSAIVDVQRSLKSEEYLFPDPCGIVLKRVPGTHVNEGEILASVRVSEDLWTKVKSRLRAAFFTVPNPTKSFKVEEVSDV